MKTGSVEKLAAILFEGEVSAADFKTMPGTRDDLSVDILADSLLNSMKRLGLVESDKLVDKNN